MNDDFSLIQEILAHYEYDRFNDRFTMYWTPQLHVQRTALDHWITQQGGYAGSSENDADVPGIQDSQGSFERFVRRGLIIKCVASSQAGRKGSEQSACSCQSTLIGRKDKKKIRKEGAREPRDLEISRSRSRARGMTCRLGTGTT